MIRSACLAAALLAAGCASSPSSAPVGPIDYDVVCQQLENSGKASRALRWFHASAERRASYEQVFRLATERVGALARGRAPGTWAVVADADETLLDNSKAECADQVQGVVNHDPNRWTQWVLAEQAEALPGAVAFASAVHSLGGRLIVVSNREEVPHRAATASNLAKVGIQVDVLLLAKDRNDLDKNSRFRLIEEVGIAASRLPPQQVLAYVGDNIKDFPYLSQVDIGDPAVFGTRYFLLPNPVYGSWQRLPMR
ncbi:MAG: hypothetical protein C0434_03485 [Xanthomonadaceae bacterium]|nr:hypothetical protein [Xanthomonadaceae bacterium]